MTFNGFNLILIFVQAIEILNDYIFSLSLKGLCHEMLCFWRDYKNKQVLSLCALIVLQFCCFLFDEEIKLKACSFEIS